MFRCTRSLAPLALVAFSAASAHAGLFIEPAVDLPLDAAVTLVGTTLTVVEGNGVPLSHNDATHCTGGGTATVVCTMVGSSVVAGRSGADTFTVAVDAPSNPWALSVRGRRGGDHFEVVQADGGWLILEGGKETNSFRVGASGSRLTVEPATRIDIYGNGWSSGTHGEQFDVHVDTEGYIYVQGTGRDDVFALSGTIDHSTAEDAGIDVRGMNGDDHFDIDVSDVITTDPTSARGLLYLDGDDGADTFELHTDMQVDGGVFQLLGGPGGDIFDVGHVLTAADGVSDGVISIDGEGGADALTDDPGGHQAVDGGVIDFTSW